MQLQPILVQFEEEPKKTRPGAMSSKRVNAHAEAGRHGRRMSLIAIPTLDGRRWSSLQQFATLKLASASVCRHDAACLGDWNEFSWIFLPEKTCVIEVLLDRRFDDREVGGKVKVAWYK